MSIGLVVSVLFARYLGPYRYGIWNYSVAFTSIIGTIAPLGIKAILVRELVRRPKEENELMGSALVVRLVGGGTAFCMSVLLISWWRSNDQVVTILVSLLSAAFVFQSLEVIDLYFQSKIKSKMVVIATDMVFILGVFFRLLFMFFQFSLFWFAILVLFESMFNAFMLIFIYEKSGNHLFDWRFKFSTAKQLIKDGWPLLFGAVSAVLYMRIDQIMIGELLDETSVGYYAVAVKLSESFIFLSVIISKTIAPYMTSIYENDREHFPEKVRQYYAIMMKLAVILSILLALFGKDLIYYLFSDKFFASAKILTIYVWSSIFIFLSDAAWVYYINLDLQHLAALRHVVGAIVNIALNMILIRVYGLVGAALATLISYAVLGYFYNLLHPALKTNFYWQTLALLDLLRPSSYMKTLQLLRGCFQ